MNTSIVDEIMLEFGSYTCADVSLETVQIAHVPEEISFNYKLACDLWANFRRSDEMCEKYGPLPSPAPLISDAVRDWYKLNVFPVFERFIKIGAGIEGPYYLCICRESGDEYFIRRALPNDKFTNGKFMTVDCQFSKMSDCVPRNKLANVRTTDGEYLLFVIHKPGSLEDQEKLQLLLDQYLREGIFALT